MRERPTRRKPDADMSEVDRATADRYVRLTALLEPQARVERERRDALLALRPGERVLDIGAGAGADARRFARRVAPGGRVVAIDKSADFVAAAIEAGSDGVEFRRGRVEALEFDDGAFDVVHAARVLQHVDDPGTALAEMARVTRPGGRVVVTDADYGCTAIDASDRAVTRAVVHARADAAPQGWIGRQLPRLFREAGLTVDHIEPQWMVWQDHDLTFEALGLASCLRERVERGEIRSADADAWLEEQAARAQAGTFLVTTGGLLVAGTRPD